MGGMFGESKFDVLQKVPNQYIPKMCLISQPTSKHAILDQLRNLGLQMPLIFKPDLGERGFRVMRIESEEDIDGYLKKTKFDFIAQELIDLPLEFGVFYTRFPHQPNGRVTSIVIKEMLTVTGDGVSTLQELILGKDRAKLQWLNLKEVHQERLHEILIAGEKLELVSIGNHCLGTKFLDGSHLINPLLSETFDHIAKLIHGFYFGRFDLRCQRIEDLYSGDFKIMELNGCGAEPGHIYQPGYSLRHAISVLLEHWRNIYIIAQENTRRGVSYTPFVDALGYYRKFKAALK